MTHGGVFRVKTGQGIAAGYRKGIVHPLAIPADSDKYAADIRLHVLVCGRDFGRLHDDPYSSVRRGRSGESRHVGVEINAPA
jgi:hypothetical protein